MKEEDELLRKYGAQNPFAVPEGYFERFAEELMGKLPEKAVAAPEEVTLWQRVKPWVYMAAMFCGLMFTIRVIVGPSKQNTPLFTSAEVEEFPDEYLESILDHSMMNDYTFYQYLTEADIDY